MAYKKAVASLLSQRDARGHWEGHLSSSALSTATAVTALWLADIHTDHSYREARLAGLRWLCRYVNADGGWGDTVCSSSNLSTTVLVWAAFASAPEGFADARVKEVVAAAERWITSRTGSLDRDSIARSVIQRYGKDRTFSVPILTLCALSGRFGTGKDAWKGVIPLPFELAAFPRSWFARLRLPVVSYALPALIAIGLARFVHAPPRMPLLWAIRSMLTGRVLDVLESVQPPNGGFLEATPLTSFVTMSLLGSGMGDHPVARKGLEFLRTSQRPDGSWPIDAHLATWVTTLSVNSLETTACDANDQERVLDWLLAQQYRVVHPYTQAKAGGWAWSPLPGGVPDADDTAGALLAIRTLAAAPWHKSVREAVELGTRWLLQIQNRDGGIPTFCRGWGNLPFDRSSTDITAHALLAWNAWDESALGQSLSAQIQDASRRALRYLEKEQQTDGSWVPLWFGNEHAPGECNPMYGTSRVVRALVSLARSFPESTSMVSRGVEWILRSEVAGGGFGGAPGLKATVEESALALETLARVLQSGCVALNLTPALHSAAHRAVERTTRWLVGKVETGEFAVPAPIGFYFAKLWYFESLYPQIWTVAALTAVRSLSTESGKSVVRGG